MIVIWNAILLHARWSGVAKIRGIASIAIFGNVVTAWSWFGTNMLGVGLHSYGFMDKAFNPLMSFISLQLGLIAVVYLIPYFDLFASKFKRRPESYLILFGSGRGVVSNEDFTTS